MHTTVIYEPAGRAREYAELAANLYRGCPHFCSYCFSPSATFTDRSKFHNEAGVRPGVMKKFAADCRELQGRGKRILLSFTTDPYSPLDDEYALTRQAIQALHEHGLFVEILTKGGKRAEKDFDLLGKGDAFASTLTFLDAGPSLEWEPFAALPEDRIETIKHAHEQGIETWVSLEPVIDPAQSLAIIRRTHSFVDQYKVGTLNHHPHARSIDWRKFACEAVALLSSLGKRHYIKQDLRRFLSLTGG